MAQPIHAPWGNSLACQQHAKFQFVGEIQNPFVKGYLISHIPYLISSVGVATTGRRYGITDSVQYPVSCIFVRFYI